MKKVYVAPTMRVVDIVASHFFAVSKERTLYMKDASSREATNWDDEEEEIEDSMWK